MRIGMVMISSVGAGNFITLGGGQIPHTQGVGAHSDAMCCYML